MPKITLASLARRLSWLNFPAVLLVALLQRTPLLRVTATAGDIVIASPLGAVLKAGVASLGALGAFHSMAGATQLVASTPSPASATVGVPITPIALTVSGTLASPASFTIGGTVPPGLLVRSSGATSGGVTTGVIDGSAVVLSGTPTAAGTFSISITAWQLGSGQGTSSGFDYVVVVTGAAATASSITTQPTAQTVNAGAAVTFSVVASGTPTPTYQWRKDGTAIAGATSASLALTNVQTANAGSYTVVVTNSAGSVTSNAATLTVNTVVVGNPPAITVQPSSMTAALGSTVSFSVTATGVVTQQWRKNGAAIAGATASTLTLLNLTAADAANYDVVLTNASGTTTSAAATLLLNAGLTARLSNVSVLTTLAANQVLTVGLTMQGGAKPVLLRAAGPGLGALGVPGTMPDPELTLFNSSSVEIAYRDDYRNTIDTAATAAFTAVGAFALPASSLDAALLRTVTGGNTAKAAGSASATNPATNIGTVIVEVYDAGSGNTPRLTNLSALNTVSSANLLIAGFTLAGTGTKTVLIRAVGPGLTALGVGGAISNPKLELYNSSSALINANDDWASSLSTTFSAVGAFALTTGSRDAALLVTLPAGGYTVQVSGVAGATGLAIVEVYEVP
jgi:hypothetical protein